MQYIRLSRNFIHNKLIPATDSVYDHIGNDTNASWYRSVFKYNQNHFDEYEKSGSLSGADDVYGNMLYWDFDDVANLEQAKKDSQTLITRLSEFGITAQHIMCYFSGKKGFSIIVNLNKDHTPAEIKQFCLGVGAGLDTLDDRIYDNQRILRVPLTAHQDTGLFKIPLTIDDLNLKVEEIIHTAQEPNMSIKQFLDISVDTWDLKDEYVKKFAAKKRKKKALKDAPNATADNPFPTIDWSKRLKFLTPEKYVLYSGYFPPGKRHDALMILASTYRMLGYTATDSYRLLKTTIERQAELYQQDPFSTDELWVNIIQTVYSDHWNGGVYGANHPLLNDIVSKLPVYLRRQVEDYSIVGNDYIFGKLDKFMDDLKNSRLTSGIKVFDKNVMLLSGNTIGIVATPGGGKTTLVLNIMRNYSKIKAENQACIFYSLDMNAPMIGLKQVQFVSGQDVDGVISMRENQPEEYRKFRDLAYQEFGNIDFSFKTGINAANIREDIIKYEESTGRKVQYIVIDYLETIQSEILDPNFGPAKVSQQIRDIAADLDLLAFILLQTQKSVHPGSPIEDMRAVKGGSQIEQSLSVIIGAWREGQPVKYQEYDTTISCRLLKNRFGWCRSFDLGWDGKTGLVTDPSPNQLTQLSLLRNMKEEEKAEMIQEKHSTGW